MSDISDKLNDNLKRFHAKVVKNALWDCDSYAQFETITFSKIDSSTTDVVKKGRVRWLDIWEILCPSDWPVSSGIERIDGTPLEKAFARALWYADEARRYNERLPGNYGGFRSAAKKEFELFVQYKAAAKVTEAGTQQAGVNLDV